jgi:pimeloyl-ACP methyl ester carboxylesterase
MVKTTVIGVGVLVVLLLAFLVSGWMAIDRTRAHSRAIDALPLFSPNHSGQGNTPEQVRVHARGLEFLGRVAGFSGEGEPVLMLHGFPESSRMWQPLLTAAADAGFRAAAFDQRGYSPGARFDDVAKYSIDELEADAIAMADALGFDRFHLVAHDWGSVVSWGLTGHHADRILTYTSLSIPHPRAIGEANDTGTPLYVRLFRVPGLMEAIFSFRGFAILNTMMPATPAEQVAEYRALLSEPGATTAAFDWYRALDPSVGAAVDEVSLPVLYIFGNRDMPVYVGEAPRAAQVRWLTGPYRSIELDAGHWLIEEQPEAVISAVLEHIQAARP